MKKDRRFQQMLATAMLLSLLACRPAHAAPAVEASAATSHPARAATKHAKETRHADVPPPFHGYPTTLLPLPDRVENDSTVRLRCGRTYGGTLDLTGKSNVQVQTEGSCGKASITPGRAVQGWRREHGGIWSAAVSFTPVQVEVSGRLMDLAHFPNRPQVWAKGKSDDPSIIRYAMPNADLEGATVVYRPFEWMIETREIAGYRDGAIMLGPKKGDAYPPAKNGEFYVEGKLWMLDSPGEWAVEGGRLYLWTPDGGSPEGRVWAAPKASGINATDSRNVRIQGVRIFSAVTGIDGSNSQDLQVRHVEIENSLEDGIFAGGRGLTVDHATIRDSGKNGIIGFYGIRQVSVTNSTVIGTGMVGMPKRSKGGIVFEQADGQQILNNRVLDSSYIGIRVHRNAVVAGNTVDRACLILSDCGGIYTFAPDKQPLNVRIDGNTVKNLAQRTCYAIYLDESANDVLVTHNTLIDNPGGLEMNNGFNNMVMSNLFQSSGYEHVLLNETGQGASIHHNEFAGNRFVSTRGEVTYRLWSVMGGSNVRQFAAFDNNAYSGPTAHFAEVAGTGMLDYDGWKRRMQQDMRSVMNAQSGGKAEGSSAKTQDRPRSALEKLADLVRGESR